MECRGSHRVFLAPHPTHTVHRWIECVGESSCGSSQPSEEESVIFSGCGWTLGKSNYDLGNSLKWILCHCPPHWLAGAWPLNFEWVLKICSFIDCEQRIFGGRLKTFAIRFLSPPLPACHGMLLFLWNRISAQRRTRHVDIFSKEFLWVALSRVANSSLVADLWQYPSNWTTPLTLKSKNITLLSAIWWHAPFQMLSVLSIGRGIASTMAKWRFYWAKDVGDYAIKIPVQCTSASRAPPKCVNGCR